MAHIRVSSSGDGVGPLNVVVVVVECVPEIREAGEGVAGAPFLVHHLDVDAGGLRNTEAVLCGADAVPGGGIVGVD